jgi:hypothetical protein
MEMLIALLVVTMIVDMRVVPKMLKTIDYIARLVQKAGHF